MIDYKEIADVTIVDIDDENEIIKVLQEHGFVVVDVSKDEWDHQVEVIRKIGDD